MTMSLPMAGGAALRVARLDLGRDFHDHAAHASVGFAGGWAACLPSFAVLAVWAGLGRAMAGRWFRWEPRRA